MTNYSPLPWTASCGEVCDANHQVVAQFRDVLFRPLKKEDSALIVLAVNNHKSLVDMLKKCTAAMDQFGVVIPTNYKGQNRTEDFVDALNSARELLDTLK